MGWRQDGQRKWDRRKVCHSLFHTGMWTCMQSPVSRLPSPRAIAANTCTLLGNLSYFWGIHLQSQIVRSNNHSHARECSTPDGLGFVPVACAGHSPHLLSLLAYISTCDMYGRGRGRDGGHPGREGRGGGGRGGGGRGGRLPPGSRPVTEGDRISIAEQLKDFQSSEKTGQMVR